MKTVYIPSADAPPMVVRAVADAGLLVVQGGDTPCDFSVCAAEQQIAAVQAFTASTGTPVQNLSLLHKPTLISAFAAVGHPTLPMVELASPDSLDGLPDATLILKPAIGAGARKTTPLAYTVYANKAELLAALSEDFWATQAAASEYDKLWVQQAVGTADGQPLQTILDGFVNGAGEVIFTPCVERTQAGAGQGPLETFEEQMPTEVQQELQEKTRQVMVAAGVRNSFFMMQFIRSPGDQNRYPVDFQYRLSYPYLHALSTYNQTLSCELMQFVYDMVPSVDVPTDLYGYVRKIAVNVNNRQARELCATYKVVPANPFFVADHIYAGREDREIMFFTYGTSVANAKADMDQFQQAITA